MALPTWIEAMKNVWKEKASTSENISGRYGLNIVLKPPKQSFTSKEDGLTQTVSNGGLDNENPIAKLFFEEHEGEKTKQWYEHLATLSNFSLVHISKDQKKISIQNAYEKSTSSMLAIYADPGTDATIIINNKSSVPVMESIKVIAQRNAKIKIICVDHLEASAFQWRLARVDQDASIIWTGVSKTGAYTRTYIQNDLLGKGAEGNISYAYITKGENKHDIYTESLHNEEHTSSDILTKGVIDDKGKALSRGLVKIKKDSPHSNGYETQEAILLSQDAEADAIPNLEIDNPEVKCSHGSTIGQIDKEKMFYLQSRGLTEQQAKQKMIEGFFLPVLDKVDESIKESFMESL